MPTTNNVNQHSQVLTDEVSAQPHGNNTSHLPVHTHEHHISNPRPEDPLVHVTLKCAPGSSEDEDESSQLFDLANSILDECKDAISLANIDTAVYLFQEALDRRPAQHPLQSESLKDLAGALVTRFSLTNQRQDLDQAVMLRGEVMSDCNYAVTATAGLPQFDKDPSAECEIMFAAGWDDSEAAEMTKLAKITLANVNQSAELSSLDTAVTLHREAIYLRTNPHPKRVFSLNGLATALYARYHRTDGISDLNEAITVLREAVETLPESDTYRADLLSSLSAMLATRFVKTGELMSLCEVMEWRRNVFQGTASDDTEEADQLLSFATEFYYRFKESHQTTDLDTAISLFNESLALLPVHHPNRLPGYNTLANALLARFEQSGQREDLDKSISFYRDLLELRPAPHPDQSLYLNNLANSLLTRFEQSGKRHDLDEAISYHKDALELRAAPHPGRPNSLRNLANSLMTRFKQSGQREDLEKSISYSQDALELQPAPHPDRSTSLNQLANALLARFHQSGQHMDLDKAILFHQDALELRPAPHPSRSSSLNDLANALKTRFEQSGQHEDLEKMISYNQDALKLLPPRNFNRSTSLSNLANSLLERFKQISQDEDLDKGISFHQNALELRPAPHPDRSMSLNNLATSLLIRFNQSGQREDLDNAILLHRDALELRPAPHSDRSMSLSNLADALRTRSQQSGQREDLDEAISFHRDALELRPALHPDRSAALNNLAITLQAQFELSGQYEFLDVAISFHRDALKLRPAPHPDRFTSLSNLASALSKRFQSGQHEDLDEIMSFYRDALELRPAPHIDRPGCLNNIAIILDKQFKQSGRCELLDQAISFHRDALELQPAPHPDRSGSLNNLAQVLSTRFEHSGHQADLDDAINAHHEALDGLVSGHPLIGKISADLAHTLINASSQTHDPDYLAKSMLAFRAAATYEAAPVSARFFTARSWAYHAETSGHESALNAYHAAIELLPRLAMLGLDLQSRHKALTSGSDGLARDAAACAIRSGQYDEAIELLEEGRAVFWAQALQLRTPMVDLRNVAPELEGKLRRLSFALEQGSLRDMSKNFPDIPQKVMSMEKEASYFRHLNDEWLAALEEVRQLYGFQDFLRPSRLSTLQGAVIDGPVIVLNASQTGCAALILNSTGVQHVLFSDFSFTEVTVLVKLIRYAIAQDGRDASLPDSGRACVEGLVQRMPFLSDTLQTLRLPFERHVRRASDTPAQPDDIFRYVLGVLWVSVVEPIIRLLKLQKSEVPPNVRWCPTGPFAFLPIHAAGLYLTERTESIFDYIVSSYTPTISTLLGDIPLPTNSFKMMVVIQSHTPGQKSLPCTLDELRKIEAHIPDDALVKLAPGYVKDVVSNLPATSIAHFACHGQQNTQNPLESALLLQDGQLKVSQFMQQSMPNASLAVLSACETAMGDENLPDEMIHLGATLLFAGFRGVVATMWSIADLDGPKIADTLYENLSKEAESTATNAFRPDTTKAARALHLAVAKLRSENVSFVRWVPFIHLGR